MQEDIQNIVTGRQSQLCYDLMFFRGILRDGSGCNNSNCALNLVPDVVPASQIQAGCDAFWIAMGLSQAYRRCAPTTDLKLMELTHQPRMCAWLDLANRCS